MAGATSFPSCFFEDALAFGADSALLSVGGGLLDDSGTLFFAGLSADCVTALELRFLPWEEVVVTAQILMRLDEYNSKRKKRKFRKK